MTRKIRIAVIGSGHLGRFHARLIEANTDFQLVGVVDPDTDARNALAQELHVPAFDSYQPLLDNIDAAVIATPTEYHHRIGMELLLAGKHLLVEKPLASSVSESDALVECAAAGDRILQVGHIERFNPAFLAVCNKIKHPKFIEACRFSGYSFRSTDIGVVLDLMIHDVDIILSMVHAQPIRVEAIGACVIGPQEDIANARIVFEDGCVANLSASRVSYDVVRKMQIWCPDAFIAVDYSDTTARVASPSEALLRGDCDVQKLSLTEKQQAKQRFFDDWISVENITAESCNALDNELRDFSEAIKTGILLEFRDQRVGMQSLFVNKSWVAWQAMHGMARPMEMLAYKARRSQILFQLRHSEGSYQCPIVARASARAPSDSIYSWRLLAGEGSPHALLVKGTPHCVTAPIMECPEQEPLSGAGHLILKFHQWAIRIPDDPVPYFVQQREHPE